MVSLKDELNDEALAKLDSDPIFIMAPEGQIYVCAACGKTSYNRVGENTAGERVCMPGWDESCFLHAVLCYLPGPPWTAVTP